MDDGTHQVCVGGETYQFVDMDGKAYQVVVDGVVDGEKLRC